jgi:hypothetical protein
MREIETMDEFRELKEQGAGYLLITDIVEGNTIHKLDCEHVREDKFQKKVLDEKCKSGNYYLIDDIEGAMQRYDAELCTKCMKME